MSRHPEWSQQIRLKTELERWLDDCVFWTSFEPVASSVRSGYNRKRRGVRAGVPDVLVYYRRLIGIELKSRTGKCSHSQRVCAELISRAGGRWFLVRSWRGAMVALHSAGIPFRTVGGKRWRPPELPEWERPKNDPKERRPRAPLTAEARRARIRAERLRRESAMKEAAE